MPARAVEPDKGGRGIEQLRLFWMPNPAAARMRGTSYAPRATSIWSPLQGIFPFHLIDTSHGRRKQRWSSEARVPGALQTAHVAARVTSTAPCTPSLTDLSIALSLAPGSAAPPSLVAGLPDSKSLCV